MNLEELQAAVDLVARDMEFMNKRLLQEGITPDPQSDLVLEAARMWLNPNIEAAYAAMLDAIERRGVPDKYVAKATVAAAFTPQGATDDS